MDNKRDVFISYHMDSSRQIVQYLCNVLESRGITCWFAPRDCEENFAAAIVGAIRNCRIFLMILNEKSAVSEHCINEVAIAFDRFSKHEQIVLLPFRVDNCQLSDTIYYYFNRIHIHDGSLPPELERIHELADRISLLLGKNTCAASVVTDAKTKEEKTYQLISQIVYPDTDFVGRRQEIAAIHKQMSGIDNKLFLTGMGGIGKSEIAKMYLKTYADDYNVVVWVDFLGTLQETITSDTALHIKGLVRTDFPGEDDRAYMHRKLDILKSITDKKILFVVDNFDVLQDPDLELFCSGTYGVIFTTRNHHISSRIPTLEILPMEDDRDLMDLFRTAYTRALDPIKEETVRQIIRHLNGHTLSIRLVGQTMQEKRISPEKMLAMLQSGLSGMEKINAKAADQLSAGLKHLFHLSDFTGDERYLMQNLSLIPNSGISVELFFALCEMDDFDVIDRLIDRSWVVHDVIQDRVHLHPLIAELMLEQLLREPENCNTYVENLVNRCESLVQNTYEAKLEHSLLSQCVCERLPDCHPLYDSAVLNLAENNFNISFYDKARENCYVLLQSTKPEYQLQGYYHLAHMATLSGRHRECLELAERGYALAQTLTQEQIDTFRYDRRLGLISRIAQSSRALGDYEKAVEYFTLVYQATLERAEKCNFDDASSNDHAWSEYHLSNALFMVKEYEEAERLARSCAERFQKCGDIWSFAHATNLVGHYEVRNGNLQEGLRRNREAMDILLPRQGVKHLGRAKKLASRGDLYAASGIKEKAFEYWEQAVALFEELGFPLMAEATRKNILALQEDRFEFIIAP